ncbi:hypothetical protein STRAU_5817 [Streptomyces aurantiacus JA 4570]|uniref:Uncharacterized protein n=1 Tax=Streptomyces aurantiacus JA 4570 TaxID=1286094 RepID=S3ZRX3_9ACTN|nr:hypothetical protein STRAU_5817 [Streptomyces aurantiacus JA 4570]
MDALAELAGPRSLGPLRGSGESGSQGEDPNACYDGGSSAPPGANDGDTGT